MNAGIAGGIIALGAVWQTVTGAVFMLIRYPINKRMFGRIFEALEKQKAGEEIDMTEFSKI